MMPNKSVKDWQSRSCRGRISFRCDEAPEESFDATQLRCGHVHSLRINHHNRRVEASELLQTMEFLDGSEIT